ncbi:MAG: inositol 2-dehydrogenase, partial [Caldithrix sp.]
MNIAIIGAGRIGKLHAENLAHRIKNARPAAITDVIVDAARQTANELQIPIVETDYKRVLADKTIDAVLICSSTNTHAQIIQEAAEAGKHVFCEKPVDLNLQRIQAVLECVEKSGVKFQVGFNRRFDVNFSRLKEKLSAGEIGTPHILRITSRDPAPPPLDYVKISGGIFLDMTIHD